MRLLPLLLLLLALPAVAAQPDPGSLVPAGASWALVAPSAGAGADNAAAFLQGPGSKSALLSGFGPALRSSLGLNPFEPGDLAGASTDLRAPLVLFSHQGLEVLVIHFVDEAGARAHLDKWLASAGEIADAPARRGYAIRTASSKGKPVAAWALQGKRAIAVRASGTKDFAASLRALLDGNKTLATVPTWRDAFKSSTSPWRLFFHPAPQTISAVALGLDWSGGRINTEGRVALVSREALLGSGAGFPGANVAGAFLVASGTVAPASLAPGGSVTSNLRWLVRQACGGCGQKEIDRLATELASSLAGPVVASVERLDEAGLRRSGTVRLTDAPFAWVAATKPGASQKLASAAKRFGATEQGPGSWLVQTEAGPLLFGTSGALVYAASDAGIRDRLLAAASAAPTKGDGPPLRLSLDPRAIARALDSLSVADALRGGKAGALFAARLEVGPLLKASGPVELEARPAGSGVLAVRGSWTP